VVKNVTGYDFCKLMAGSWGTLAALTEVTLKTLPKPETEATVMMSGLDDAAAVRAMTAAMGSTCEVSGAAHLPAATAAGFPMGAAVAAGRALTVLRLEGVAPSVAQRQAALQAALRPHTTSGPGEIAVIDDIVSRRLWVAIRDAAPFAASRGGGDLAVWRISTMPAKGHELAARVTGAIAAEVLYDWAGGLIWIAVPAAEAAAALIRSAVKAVGGHATLVRAPAPLRAAVDVFEPQETGLAALTKRVKESFDPKGVLNPGRMWAHV
jgi:glycolate oxidase FAD binding subunit